MRSRSCLAAVICLTIARSTCAFQMVDEPTGLAWTPRDVAVASAASLTEVIDADERMSPTACTDDCATITRAWSRLLPVFAEQRSPAPELSLRIVRSSSVSAFAAPDGTVVISAAFVHGRRLPEAQVALVLAHEVAHVLLQHERQMLTSALAMLPARVPRTVSDMYVELAYNHALSMNLEASLHQAEFEADEVGFQLAALAGFAPTEQLAFLDGPQPAPARALVSTHPPTEDRLARLRALLPLAERLFAYGQTERTDPR